MLERIARNPTVTIVYGDYYGATLEITRSPQKHGRLGATWFLPQPCLSTFFIKKKAVTNTILMRPNRT